MHCRWPCYNVYSCSDGICGPVRARCHSSFRRWRWAVLPVCVHRAVTGSAVPLRPVRPSIRCRWLVAVSITTLRPTASGSAVRLAAGNVIGTWPVTEGSLAGCVLLSAGGSAVRRLMGSVIDTLPMTGCSQHHCVVFYDLLPSDLRSKGGRKHHRYKTDDECNSGWAGRAQASLAGEACRMVSR